MYPDKQISRAPFRELIRSRNKANPGLQDIGTYATVRWFRSSAEAAFERITWHTSEVFRLNDDSILSPSIPSEKVSLFFFLCMHSR